MKTTNCQGRLFNSFLIYVFLKYISAVALAFFFFFQGDFISHFFPVQLYRIAVIMRNEGIRFEMWSDQNSYAESGNRKQRGGWDFQEIFISWKAPTIFFFSFIFLDKMKFKKNLIHWKNFFFEKRGVFLFCEETWFFVISEGKL